MGDDVVARATEGLRAIPIIERMGIEVLAVEPGRCVVRAPAEPNVNHFGTMYAGVLYTLGECPGGVLFFATFDGERFFPLVTGSQIRYLKPAIGPITVEATIGPDEVERLTAEAERHGKASWDLDLELVDGEGDVVATVSSHYQMRPVGSLSRPSGSRPASSSPAAANRSPTASSSSRTTPSPTQARPTTPPTRRAPP